MTLQTLSDPAAAARQSKLVIDFATDALRAGDFAEAQRLLRDHLSKMPRDAEALTKLAEVANHFKRAEEVTLLLRRAADSDPSPQRFAALLGHLQRHVGGTAVLAEIERIPPALRQVVGVRLSEAIAYLSLGQQDRQIAILEELTQVAPTVPNIWVELGEALRATGRGEESIAALREAIRRRPSGGEAYWSLANSKSFRFSDSDIASMRKALKKSSDPADSITLNFALAKALEDKGLYQQSFRHYAAANDLQAARVDVSDMFVSTFVDAGLALMTPEFFERGAGAGATDPSPIFVVGMHRAGSTLVEQILASHPEIEGTTELNVMQNMWNRMWRDGLSEGRNAFQQLAQLGAGQLKGLGEEYLERAGAFRTTSDLPFFVDKLPPNWMHVGLIRLILPKAKIIDARRHPMACGFSNFKQHYRGANPFSCSQESIGVFYRDYWRFMAHFEEVQPGAVHRVVNEQLIEDPEGEVRRMLDFIGVPFDPACLAHHENNRAVRTPSAEQVRRPINRDGVDAWKNYEPWLGPLKAALGPALEHWND